jgi:hypothetical protein
MMKGGKQSTYVRSEPVQTDLGKWLWAMDSEFGDKIKVVHIGDAASVLWERKAHVLWVEVTGPDRVNDDVLSYIAADQENRLVLYGHEQDVAAAALLISKGVPEVEGRHTAVVYVHVSHDDALGPRSVGELSSTRVAMLMSPTPFASHKTYVVNDIRTGLPASVMATILNIFNLPVAPFYRNLVYMPAQRRALKDVITLMAQMQTVALGWQFAAAMEKQHNNRETITADLNAALTRAETEAPDIQREADLMWAGVSVTKETVVDKAEADLKMERRRESVVIGRAARQKDRKPDAPLLVDADAEANPSQPSPGTRDRPDRPAAKPSRTVADVADTGLRAGALRPDIQKTLAGLREPEPDSRGASSSGGVQSRMGKHIVNRNKAAAAEKEAARKAAHQRGRSVDDSRTPPEKRPRPPPSSDDPDDFSLDDLLK